MMRPGQPIAIRHGKPWRTGRPIHLRGWVESYDGERLVVARRFTSSGMPYDGLEAVQRPGDRGLVELLRGAWISRRRYFRRDGQLIGDLYNVQTPTTFDAAGAGYVDLEIDVAYLPHRQPPVVIQDVAELEATAAAGHIPAELAAIAHQLAGDLADRLRRSPPEDEPSWNVVPDEAALAAPVVRAFLARAVSRPAA
jgi:hypothetical protein